MKKFVSLFLSLVMLLSITSGLTFNVYAATPTTGKCGENIIWKYNSSSKTLTLSGTGAIDSFSDDDDFSYSERPWKEYIDEIKNIKIEEGITSIGDYTFKNLGEINNIEIPKSLISIGKLVFEECKFNQVSYNGTNSEFFVIKNIENNTELIIGKFNPILNELLSKPIEVEYKQSEYQKLTKEYLTKKVADIINNDKNAQKNNINIKNGHLYINNIEIAEVSTGFWNLLLPGDGIYPDEPHTGMSTTDNFQRLHQCSVYVKKYYKDEDDYFYFYKIDTSIKYINDSDYNVDDKQYVDNFVKTLNIARAYYHEVDYTEYMKVFTKHNYELLEYCNEVAKKYYKKQISDNLIDITVSGGSGGTEGSLNFWHFDTVVLGIYKNDFLYNAYEPEVTYYINDGHKIEMGSLFIPVITLPDNLPDNQIENYIMQKINDDWRNNNINGIIKGAKLENGIEIENGYTLKSNGYTYLNSIIIARRSDSYVPSSPTPGGSTSGGGGFTPAPTPEDTDKKDEDQKPETKPAQPTAPTDTTNKSTSVKVNKTQAKKKALVVYWNKIANVSGYQIQVATDKKFKKSKKTVTVAKQNASKKTVKKLKAKKKYFVRIRAYKIVDGKKSYGKWSKIKSAKTK